jgi:hypothetical protein
MKKFAAYFAPLLIMLVVIAGIVYYEVSVWHECLKEHAWWYCLRILN